MDTTRGLPAQYDNHVSVTALREYAMIVASYARPVEVGINAFRELVALLKVEPKLISQMNLDHVKSVMNAVPNWLGYGIKGGESERERLYYQHIFLIRTAIEREFKGFISVDALRLWQRIVNPSPIQVVWPAATQKNAAVFMVLVTRNRDLLGAQAQDKLDDTLGRAEAKRTGVPYRSDKNKSAGLASQHGSTLTKA